MSHLRVNEKAIALKKEITRINDKELSNAYDEFIDSVIEQLDSFEKRLDEQKSRFIVMAANLGKPF